MHVLKKELVEIQEIIEGRFTMKRVSDMIKSKKKRSDVYFLQYHTLTAIHFMNHEVICHISQNYF